ncbi:hypothetical protein CTZ27_19645 [Streptomyces griseocarneus]|nr:hypothetical protein CTZ27_19645 [Streptomyces griseocarneus]
MAPASPTPVSHNPPKQSNPLYWRRLLLASLTAPVVGAADVGVYLRLRDRLPGRLATHIGSGGAADGFSGHGGFLTTALVLILGIGLLFGAIVHWVRAASGLQRGMTAVGCALYVFIGSIFAALLLANADVDDPASVNMSGWQVGIPVLITAAAGGLGWLVAGAEPAPAPADSPPPARAVRLSLAKGEVASWSRPVGSRVLPLVGLATVVAGVVVGSTVGWGGVAVPLLLGGVPVALLTGARVTVDRRGLIVAPKVLPRPRLTIPLERMVEATHREVDAMRDFGGWGYRVTGGASGVILRSGDAVSVRLTNGTEFAVTVDDAATAAALLNSLADRERTPGA